MDSKLRNNYESLRLYSLILPPDDVFFLISDCINLWNILDKVVQFPYKYLIKRPSVCQ